MRKLIRIAAEMRWGTVLLPWMAAALGILAMKFSLLHRGGFHETALFLGHPGKLPITDSLALFRGDLLVMFLLIPAAILLATSGLSRLAAVHTCAWIAGLVTLLTAFEVHVWDATGSFTTLRMAWMLLAWEVASRDHAFLAIRPQVYIAVGGLLLLVVLFTVAALILLRRRAERLERASVSVFAGACMLGVIAWLPPLPAGAWTPPLVDEASYSFFLQSIGDSWKAKHMQAYSAPQLIQMYRASARVPAPQPSPWFGKARNANIVIFTMESMTAHALDPARDSLDDMPNLRRLREHAFVMGRHYTSFPQTDYAVFSLLTSLYAHCFVKCSGSELVQDGGPQVSGLIRVLNAAGYQTGFYGYVWRIAAQRDDLLLKSLGFEHLREPTIDPREDRDGLTTFFGPTSYTAGHDLQALGLLRRDIHQWTSAHQRFAAMYFPEIGHDPYRALDGSASSSPLARGHALAVLQDAWLGQIMDELQQDGVLDNTIIVVTGDHGMRFTSTNANGERTLTADGKLDDTVMRVPMLIYVPQALSHTVRIDYPTSHIDLMPTLFDLLGITSGETYAQGSPMMDPRLAERRLYLPMGEYGASGYYDDGSYFMLTGMGGVYKSPTMQFPDSDALVYTGAEAASARRIEENHDTAQQALLGQLLHPGN